MEDMQKLRERHQEHKEFRAKKEEMERVQNLFLNQLLDKNRKEHKKETTIKVYKPEGLEDMRERPKSSKDYNFIKVLEMMR